MTFQTDAPSTPEAALIVAIIMQAYRDLFMTVRPDTTSGFTTQANQDQAISFLTDRVGSLARHRNHLCSLIGWDGDVLAERVRSMMEGEPFPHPTPNPPAAIRKRYDVAVGQLRERWFHLKNPHAPPCSPVGSVNAA